MALELKAKISGSKKLKAALKSSDKRIRGAVTAALYQMGFIVDADMVPRIPVDTGRLKWVEYLLNRYGWWTSDAH